MKKIIVFLLIASALSVGLVGCGGNENSPSVSSSATTSAETSSKSTQETISKMKKIPVKGGVFSASPDKCAEIINLYLVEPSPIVLGKMITGENSSWKEFTISEGTDIAFFVDKNGKDVEAIHFNSIATGEYPEKNFQDYFMATIMAIDSEMTSEGFADLCVELRFGFPRSTEEMYTVHRNGFTYSLFALENNCFVDISPQKEETSSATTSSNTTSTAPTVTTSQKNALRSAKQYLEVMPFSYTGLIEQLEYEKYSHEDAVYAADNCGADWNKQAAKAAQSYLDVMSFSRQGLIDQLQYEGYTYEQAVYGVNQVGL